MLLHQGERMAPLHVMERVVEHYFVRECGGADRVVGRLPRGIGWGSGSCVHVLLSLGCRHRVLLSGDTAGE